MINLKKSILFTILSIFIATETRQVKSMDSIVIEKEAVSENSLVEYLEKCFRKKEEKFSFEKLRNLFENGAQINATGSKCTWTPLHFICRYNPNLEIIEYLLKNSANINAEGKYKKTPLHLICLDHANLEVVKYLVKNDAQINAEDKYKNTPLHFICKYRPKLKIIEYLVENDAKINAPGDEGWTPLHLICRHDPNLEIIEYLVKKGAKINATVGKYKKTPLHFICRYYPNFEIIEYLVENGAKINSTGGKYKKTPLHFICRQYNPNFEIIEYLLKKGAKINAETERKLTPLHLVCRHHANLEVIKYLVQNGANVNSTAGIKWTLLHFICRYYPNLEIIKNLIENGANINAKGEYKTTPLHLICRQYNPNIEIIKYLIENGANPYIKDYHNKASIDYLNKKSELYKEIENLISHLTLSEDLLKYFNYINSQECSSNNLFNFNSKILGKKVNKIWIETRTGINIEILESKLNEYLNTKLKNGEKDTTNKVKSLSFKEKDDSLKQLSSIFLEWVYSGKVIDPDKKVIIENNKAKIIDETKESLVKDICLFLEINFEEKSERSGLIKDLKKLQNHKESKDFKILIKNKKENSKSDYKDSIKFEKIKVHKFILMVRSALYRGMFEFLDENKTKKVKDYSKRTVKQIEKLIDYLYTDYVNLEENGKIDVKLVESLFDAIEYYQLNQNCMLKYLIKELFKKIKDLKNQNNIENLDLDLKSDIEEIEKKIENLDLDLDSDLD